MKSIIVAGTARSGTTWLGQILQAASGYPSVFEPLNPQYVQSAGSIFFRYLITGHQYPEIYKFFSKVCSGGLRNPWTDQENPGGWRKHHIRGLMRGSRIIKMVRANLMLGWIDKKFEYPIVYILRHPCAVITSWIKLGWDSWLNHFLKQPELVEDYLHPFIDYLSAIKTPVEKIAAQWCIENIVPLNQMSDRNWIISTYEELCTMSKYETSRILSQLGLSWNEKVEEAIKRPSRSTNKQSAINKRGNPLCKWKNELNQKEIATVIDTLKLFNINLYNEDLMPKIEVLNRKKIDKTLNY